MSKSNSTQKTSQLREKIINTEIVPIVKLAFGKYPQLQSAMLSVAQYWNDEAADAVHYHMNFSVLSTPALGVELVEDDDYMDRDLVNLPGLPALYEIETSLWEDLRNLERGEDRWNDNGNAIFAFAAYCKEGCHQEMDYSEAYTPYAVFRRDCEKIAIEVVGTMLRPWLDGIRPEI
jgi:hypothetical protein